MRNHNNGDVKKKEKREKREKKKKEEEIEAEDEDEGRDWQSVLGCYLAAPTSHSPYFVIFFFSIFFFPHKSFGSRSEKSPKCLPTESLILVGIY